MDARNEDLKTGRDIYQKKLDELLILKIKSSNDYDKTQALLSDLMEMSIHPRYDCLVPITELAYTDATLINTEFMVKEGDYNVTTSQKQTYDYIENIIKGLKAKHDGYAEEHKQILERLKIVSELNLDGQITKWGENAYTVSHGEFVEIIEVDDHVDKKERKPRFKTTAERDEYLRSIHKNKTKEN